MTSGACPPSLPPSLFLLAQKRATKATTCSPCSDRASRAERGPHSTPSPQRNPLSQTRTHPFSLSSTGCSQQSVEDSGGLFLLSPFKKENSLFLLGSILEAVLPTDHQLTSFLLFFHSCFFIPALIT